MRLLKTIRLILTFYRSFILLNSLITLACLFLFFEYGLSIFKILFWFKLCTLGIVFVFINSYKSKEFYYYQNLGLSRFTLWASTFIFDFCLYLFLLTQVYKLRP